MTLYEKYGMPEHFTSDDCPDYDAKNTAAHNAYYEKIVKDLGYGACARCIEFDDQSLVRSKDPYFNDLPLGIWDASGWHIAGLLDKKHVDGYSLSQLVCIAKACGHMIVREYQAG